MEQNIEQPLPESNLVPQVISQPTQESSQIVFEKPHVTFAGYWVRAAATLIDGFLICIPVVISLILTGNYFDQDASSSKGRSDILEAILGVIFVALSVFFVTRFGASPGKMFYGLRIIRKDGTIPDIKTAILRETLGKFLSGLFLSLGYLWVVFDKEKRSLHDIIAGTHVVLLKPLSRGRKILIFMLVAILPLIAIVGILAAVVLVAFNPAGNLSRSRDGVRKADISQLARAIRLYQSENGSLPPSTQELIASKSITLLPKDPKGSDYVYTLSSDGKSASLYATLEKGELGKSSVYCWKGAIDESRVFSIDNTQEVASASECQP